jgi:hypothetical protein
LERPVARIIDVYTAWEWPALCEAVSCLRVDPERLPGRIHDISYDICVSQNANARQSLRLFGGGGGNRTAGDSPDLDDSRTVLRTSIEENTSKEHEQNALPDVLMTMSQIPDVNRELAEVGAVFDVLRQQRGRES